MMEMFKEDGVYSLTRVLPTLGYLIFLAVSLYLAASGKEWAHYGEFTAATGTAAMVQLGNKFINSRYNTRPGEPGKVINNERQ